MQTITEPFRRQIYQWLKLIGCFSTVQFFAILSVLSAHAQQRPNILWLSVEDMSPHLGSYGERLIATPNLDKLAARAIRYNNALTAAGVCAPSRNAIITGRMQTSNGGHNMRTLNNTYPEQTGLPKS